MKKLLLIIAIAVMFISCSEEATGPNVSQMDLDAKEYEIQKKELIATGYSGYWDISLSKYLNSLIDTSNLIGDELTQEVAKKIYSFVGNQYCGVDVRFSELKYSEGKLIYEDIKYIARVNYKLYDKYSSNYHIFYIFKKNNIWYDITVKVYYI